MSTDVGLLEGNPDEEWIVDAQHRFLTVLAHVFLADEVDVLAVRLLRFERVQKDEQNIDSCRLPRHNISRTTHTGVEWSA